MRIVALPNPWVLLKVMLSPGFSLEFLETHLYGLSKLWLPPKHEFANGAPFNISQKLKGSISLANPPHYPTYTIPKIR
jgi:hypothetical protein